MHLAHLVSPYPISYDGNALLFWLALFAEMVICSLSIMLGTVLGKHLWHDRARGIDAVAALRSLVLAVCIVFFMNFGPDIAYMISYADAAPNTLRVILLVKRTLSVLSLFAFLFWTGTFWVWYAEIVLRLLSSKTLIWTDSRLPLLKRFASVVVLSAALAGSITLGLAFR